MKKLFAWLGVATLAVLARPAYAGDPLKPFVVMVVDTSGSMASATGSGPPSCGGADTRLNHVRCAIRKIVNSYGDMVFALGRFRMSDSGNTTANTFPAGCTSTGAGTAGSATCTTTTDMFQLLTPLVDGANDAADSWVNITGNTCKAGRCSVTTATSCSLDTDCPGTETCNLNADPEMWNASGNTPIEGSLNGAKQYWIGTQFTSPGNFLIWPSNLPGFAPITNDPTNNAFLPKPGKSATCNPNPATCDNTAGCTSATNCCCLEQCRPYITIMLTDGQETCTGNAAAAGTGADALLRTDVNNKRYRIETKPIGFGIAPGDANIEALAHAGGATDVNGVNEGFYVSDETSLQLALSSILDDAIRTEVCNNLDDDCDGNVDEDFPGKGGACDNGAVSICHRDGNFVCKADGTGLQCNAPTGTCVNNHLIIGGVDQGNNTCLSADNDCDGIDDDCDGKVDEGNPACNCSPTQEICDGLDNDCDGRVDEASTNGPKLTRPCGTGTCGGVETCDFGSTATGHCGTVVGQAFCHCTAATPTAELCNGKDDNCDGVCDGFSSGCSNMTGVGDNPANNPGDPSHNPDSTNICHPGQKTCNVNCSGSNAFSSCQNEVKPCNNPANNAQPLPNLPGNPRHPNPTCLDGCNGLDDDCDGNVDEDFAPADCSNGCGVGTTKCTGGVLSCDSTAAPPGSDTSCDGVDQDCDNKFDEDFACADATPKPGFPATCNPKTASCDDSPTCTDPTNCCCQCSCTASGFCGARESCVGGTRLCQGVPVSQESCDCSDNNCNGQVDEGNLCAAGSICNQFCQCAFQCAAGEFPCPLGKFCKKETDRCSNNTATCDASDACTQDPSRTDCCCRSLCIADPCFNHPCPAVTAGTCQTSTDCGSDFACVMGICTQKQICVVNDAGNQATCVSACSEASCAPLICIANTGECKPDDCTTFPERCGANQNCINGTCVTNPCIGVTCPTDQYCVGGSCAESCANKDCPSGQRCRLGVCETDPCGHPCPFGQACNDNTGKCVDDSCPGKTCPTGQWCNPNNNGGTCENDPCVGTMCPSGEQICRGGTCFDPADFLPDAGVEVRVTTGGGGGCNTGGDAGGAGLLLGLALFITRRARAKQGGADQGGAR